MKGALVGDGDGGGCIVGLVVEGRGCEGCGGRGEGGD